MRLFTALVLAAVGQCLPGFASAETQSPGEAFYAPCATCHGDRAQGDRTQGAPRLNHLAPVYLSAQLMKFRAGQRGGEGATPRARNMAAMAQALPGEDAVDAVAGYIASFDSPAPAATLDGDPALGKGYYRQLCGACHGPAAQGNRALHSPGLAGTDDWYLASQLRAFREGTRGMHPEDRNGRQMRAMAATLPDEQAVRDIVSYIRGLAEQ